MSPKFWSQPSKWNKFWAHEYDFEHEQQQKIQFHWLSYPQHVTFKLCLTTYKCLHGLAPPYLTRFCTPLSAVAGRTHLHSADQHKLFVPARLHRRLVHWCFPHRACFPGMLFPCCFVTQPSPSASSDNTWKLIFLTTILIDSVSLLFCTFIGFLQFRLFS